MDRSLLDGKDHQLQPRIEEARRRFRLFKHSLSTDHRHASALRLLSRYVFRVHTLLILLWIWLLNWGEVRVFEKDLRGCNWHNWEKWEPGATPHHVAFVADPQLVDPHTYPGRPWPLSSLTVTFTDKYLKRSYRTLQSQFDPDTVYFLGDLFDGGREWSTDASFEITDDRWKGYGMKYWLKEYERFARIFFTDDQISGGAPARRAKQIIASLPGNHDLGFANGIQVQTRGRFQALFGEGDRVDVIGNHSFVGIDSVSLSAKAVEGGPERIWGSSNEFLERAQGLKRRRTGQLVGRVPHLPDGRKFLHEAVEPQVNTLLEANETHTDDLDSLGELPTVLLSHVPLYREPGTKCGPGREKYPPTDLGAEKDERNAIRVAAGYQYQNVLDKGLTKIIAEKVGHIDYAFSGDDHDYCETVHRAYPSAGSGIREITVKSLSWAMGVSRPGFVLASLWNPIDSSANPLPGSPGARRLPTLHSQLCLLPNQLAVFIQYAFYGLITLVALLLHSVIHTLNARAAEKLAGGDPILPLDEPIKSRADQEQRESEESIGLATSQRNVNLASRKANTRSRGSTNPDAGMGGYALLANGSAGRPGHHDAEKKSQGFFSRRTSGTKKRRGFCSQWAGELGRDMLWVAVPGLGYFLWLWRQF